MPMICIPAAATFSCSILLLSLSGLTASQSCCCSSPLADASLRTVGGGVAADDVVAEVKGGTLHTLADCSRSKRCCCSRQYLSRLISSSNGLTSKHHKGVKQSKKKGRQREQGRDSGSISKNNNNRPTAKTAQENEETKSRREGVGKKVKKTEHICMQMRARAREQESRAEKESTGTREQTERTYRTDSSIGPFLGSPAELGMLDRESV